MNTEQTTATLFTDGVIWTGNSDTNALLVIDGRVRAVGDQARALASEIASVERVDLDGGFLMPSFGDGHAHPLYGGLEAAGPAVRDCGSVDDIVLAVKQFAADNPDQEWIVGASYDGSLAPDGLFDSRWLDAAVPDRPVVLRAWDYHTMWCNSLAIERAGIVGQDAAVVPLTVRETVRVGDAACWIEASPPRFTGLSIDYLLDYGPGPIGRQQLDIDVTPDAYRAELCDARTFISLDDAARLREAGLGATVSQGDLVIFDAEGPVGTVLRWPDECVRHKVLDAVGDLALAGRPLHAHVRAHRSGHALNAGLVRELVALDATRWLGRTA